MIICVSQPPARHTEHVQELSIDGGAALKPKGPPWRLGEAGDSTHRPSPGWEQEQELYRSFTFVSWFFNSEAWDSNFHGEGVGFLKESL